MSFIKLYSFDVSTDHYDIYGDYDLSAVQARLNDVIISTGPTFTFSDTGFNDNDVIKKQCVGFTLQQANALLAFPYAVIFNTANAGFCGYTAPSTTCDLVIGTTTKNALNSTSSGRISVSVSPGGNYQYSIDGLNFQSNNLFNNIPAGNYIVYVRRPDGSCLTSKPVTVGQDVVDISPNYFPIPYRDSKHLFWFFRLIIGDTSTIIAEPIKWDGITISGERDTTFHGYKFKYTEGNTVLGFDCDSGKELIEAVYNQYGEDGEVLFQYGYSYFGQEYILFPGKLDLTTYHWFADRIECSVQVDDFDSTFQSRQETKVSMAASTSFDGNAVTPPSPYNLLFTAKKIITELTVSNTGKAFYYLDPLRQQEWSIVPETIDGETSDIAQTFTYTLGALSGAAKSLNFYQVKFDFDGKTDIDFLWNFHGRINIDNNGLIDGADWSFDVFYVYRKYNAATDTFTETVVNIGQHYDGHVNNLDNDDFDFTENASYTETNIDVRAKDEIYFYAYFTASRNVRLIFDITQDSHDLNIRQYQQTANTNGNVWFLDDVIRQTLNVIADNQYVFRSSFYERQSLVQLQDGCAAKSALTNGFQIRQFDVDEKPLYINFTTLVNSLRAMHCIGINYATINNVPTVRIERANFFYQDKEILQIDPAYIPGGIESYDEEVAKEMIYNDVKIGYNKFQEDGYNSLDEFNTQREKLTPIQKNKATLELLSNFITSGYSIEDIRRNQFADQPSESVSNDDEPFYVSLNRDTDPDSWVPEHDEAFDTVTNLISPETSYNLRVSPARMFYNWFIWLKGIFSYKLPTDLITNTFFIQNGLMATQFEPDESCPIGDVDRVEITENVDIPLSALATTENIYRPEWINVKCRLTPEKVQLLNMALSGQFGPSKDYGYVMVKKPDGRWQAGWVYNLSYNYFTEQLTLKMLKKYYTPQPVSDDCCDWLVANGCYVMANENRLIA